MKRKLSLLLALVMILSLVPMSAFAGSSNRVISVKTVKDDHTFTVLEGDAPILRVEEEDVNEFVGTQEFRLELTNAEWTNEMVTTKVYERGQTAGAYVTFAKRTDTSLAATINMAGKIGTAELAFDLPMLVELQGKGEAKVTINPLSSALTAGTYTIAIGQSGATTTTVGSATTFSRTTRNKGANIIIDEVVAGSIKDARTQRFTVRLPKDMKWHADTDVQFDSNFVFDGSVSKTITDNDGRDLKVEFKLASKTAKRGSITIVPYVDVTKDAKHGDVNVSITGTSADISAESNILIGKYKDWGVEVKVEEVIEIVSGRVDDDYVAKVKIKETTANSLVNGRDIDFELSDGVKVLDTVKKAEELFVKSVNATVAGNGSTFKLKDGNAIYSDEWTLKVQRGGSTTTKMEYELEIPITAKGLYSGDVVLTISGAGIEKTEVVIAKAVAPVTIETKLADVRTGLQKQAAPDIIIKENFAGALLGGKDKFLMLELKDKAFGMRFDEVKFEVIDGDIDIDLDDSDVAKIGDISGAGIKILVDGESTKASTIKVSGIKMTLDRNVPEGPFAVDVKGSSVLENTNYDDFSSRVARFNYANVITRADGNLARTSKFVIDSTVYKVLEGNVEVEKTMDVAAFIQDGRTFLPIRYVAESLGVADDNIIWNAATKTVTIMKGDRIATMTIGSKTLTVNGTAVPMDTAAMVKEGRTVLPIRYVAQALGAQIDWNGETRTVTVTQ